MSPYYQDEWVTIYHGRCEVVLPTLERPDLLLSDPPYGMNYKHGARRGGARRGGVRLGADGETVKGDAKPFDPSHLLNVAPRTILWGANHYADRLPAKPGWLIWDKRGGININDQSDCEMAWTDFLGTARVFFRQWNGALRGGREQREPRWHVSQKPVELMAWCLMMAPKARLVVDPYMGSGSTLVAARELGIRAIGIEIEERYCQIAARRLQQTPLPLIVETPTITQEALV